MFDVLLPKCLVCVLLDYDYVFPFYFFVFKVFFSWQIWLRNYDAGYDMLHISSRGKRRKDNILVGAKMLGKLPF